MKKAKIRNLSKIPKRRITVDDLLYTDDITDILQKLYEDRHEIDNFVLLYSRKDADEFVPYWHGTAERILWLLETAKFKLMMPKSEWEE
jgi:benzoyl-CoA reductase/2-hydroxyglutaryl-CoA dehydratase subunit BcrC/BadD/HgdB